MHPSVTEQLEQVQRILHEVVAAELDNPYPRDILTGVCATLETLAVGWAKVPAFLQWDAGESVEVLRVLLAAGEAALDPASTATVTRVADRPRPCSDPFDLEGWEAYHREARAALAQIVPLVAGRPELAAVRARMMTLLRERAERYPLTNVWRPASRAT